MFVDSVYFLLNQIICVVCQHSWPQRATRLMELVVIRLTEKENPPPKKRFGLLCMVNCNYGYLGPELGEQARCS